MKNKRTLSLEMFPPKNEANLPKFLEVANKMASLEPDFISVTYGAGGGTKDTTLALAKEISKSSSVVAHLNCDGLTNKKLDEYLASLKENGIENVLALRGDTFDSRDFSNSLDLTKAVYGRSNFCVGSACYPELHPDSRGYESDLFFYHRKVAAGARFFITQLCYSPVAILGFIQFMREGGIREPIIVGIMPLIKPKSVQKALDMGVWVPPSMIESAKYESEELFRLRGIRDCIQQINFLYDAGVEHIHLYTMNDYEATREIVCGTGMRPYR